MGDRRKNLSKALRLIGELPLTTVEAVSPAYLSEPLGNSDQEWFCNAVFRIRTILEPERLLMACKSIERRMGRPAQYPRWGPRIIDLDILLYDDLDIRLKNLEIPHPEMHRRKFVLVPLLDLDDPFHPGLRQRIHELLESCQDRSTIQRQKHRLQY
ncbi:2-amino-4-hydroxy-6-hydroxymethyldihydropteridine diphosphokinase [Prosthecochloris sp. GSB1]|nr:2-amino-4-hydroxy-6-hydroxymethyldihydropteridine diphosphokinase [Prosthecochloris sp. GSB1]